MTRRELKRWNDAMRIAAIAMGKDERSGVRGHPRYKVNRAEEDPLAWWCLVELIYNFGSRKT